jgi:ATP-dependent exoDNAse (exonuclease V) beta subunit
MSYKSVPDTLAKRNAHERDQFITFDEGPHIYTVYNKLGYTSVTTWNHRHFTGFDAPAIVNNIMKSKKINDPSYKYYGMTREDILTQWRNNGNSASTKGTQLHYDIECFYNEWKVENNSIEYSYFQNFVKDNPNLKPYRTEWIVFYEELKMSGSIDMVFENEKGEFVIYDWKRCNEIPHESNYNQFATTSCISHLPDAKFWHYALQLNMYKVFLEHKYDKKVSGMFLVSLHPDNPYKNYDRIEVPVLEVEIKGLLELRKREALTIELKPE